MPGRRGRPRGPCRGDSEEINALALLLQAQLDQAGMSVRGLCSAAGDRHFPAGVPSPATVQRRLGGEGLGNARPLIEAIIDLCTPPAQREDVRAEAFRLMRKAASTPTPVGPAASSDELAMVKADLGRVRLRLLGVQRELLDERKLRIESEQRAARNTTVVTSLFALLSATARPLVPESPAFSEPPVERMTRQPEVGEEPAVAESPDDAGPDRVLESLAAAFQAADPDGSRVATCLRRTIDRQLDGSHTGRFQWSQLSKAERAAIGTLVALAMAREFGFAAAEEARYQFGGAVFEIAFSTRLDAWSLPADAVGRLFLLVQANDHKGVWSTGLVRLDADSTSSGGPVTRSERRAKLNSRGLARVRWLRREAVMIENVLANLPQSDVVAIFAPRTGQARVDELLRRVRLKRISRTVVDTVALQQDGARRVRDARAHLRQEGIVVLGGSQLHQDVAAALGLPVPDLRGQWVSARVAQWEKGDAGAHFEVNGRRWRLAEPGEPIRPAPELPS